MSETPIDIEEAAFQAAVAWAASQLLYAKNVAPELFEPDGLEKIEDLEAGLQALMGEGVSMLARARVDWRAHRALELACAQNIRNFPDLPTWARHWLSDYLEGKLVPPPRPRGALPKGGLHHLIGECIDLLVAGGMVGVRNDATERRSACDVLAEALGQAGLQPATFEGVKRVYLSWNKQQDELEVELARRAEPTDP